MFGSSVVAYKGQQYEELKKQAIQSGILFRDPTFPPTERSLFFTPGKADNIVWKRPKDICEDPRLFVDGAKRSDLIQGDLGNCWLVAACSCLMINRSQWSQVVPDHREQDWDTRHAGIFHFRFWRFGAWTDVVIDDFLPTRDGRLIFCHSPSSNEFWPALLEKAYAKLYGSYEAMDGGELSEALEDFTGGIAENYDLSNEDYVINDERRMHFFLWMTGLLDAGSLICAAIPAKSEQEMEEMTELGLTKGHAYSVTAIRKVRLTGTGAFGLFNRDKMEMIRLRNPWGPGTEWRGPFSDGSPEWNRILSIDRDKIGLTVEDDGEFWMTFLDFCKYFVHLAICHRINTSLMSFDRRWTETALNGEWVLPHRVGGCINNRATFLNNPQYMIEVRETDEVMIELIQKMNRQPGRDRETIGFTVMQVDANRVYRIHVIMPIVMSSSFRNSRSILLRRTFHRGRYVLVPCTFEPGVLGSFLLRCYSGTSTSIRELIFEMPLDNELSCLPHRRPQCVTQIKVVGIYGMQQSLVSAIEVYCVITCEGEKVKSEVSTKSNPEWNIYAVFYRKNPLKKPVTVEVFSRSTFGFDDFLGRQVFVAARDVFEQPVELPLVGNDNVLKAGRLSVVITTSHNLQAV